MKRLFCLFLALLIAGMVFAGGGQAAGGRGAAAAPSAGKKYPNLPFATDGKTTLSMLIGLGSYANITSYEYADNTYTREVVDKTGVQLEFITVPQADFDARRSLLLASGDYPEIINGSFSFNDMAYWAGEGLIVPLDDYHYLEYPFMKKVFDEYPALNTVLRLDDGKIYATPRLDDAIWSTYAQGRGWIYMPWVRDNRNFQFPKTLDELTAYFRWIRDNDVNKNGNPNDEVPLAFSNIFHSTAYFAKSFMPFVMDSTGFGLALTNGTVVEQYRSNEYRDTLKYMAGLYKEGLIKQDVYTWAHDQLKALSLNPEPQLGMALHGFAHDVTGSTDPRWAEFFVLPPVNGPSGRHWGTNREPWGIGRGHWYVTDRARDPELVIALYDFMSTHEMFLHGENQKGKSWSDPDPGSLGLNGKPATYKRLVQELQMPQNTLWYINNAMMYYMERRMGEQAVGMDVVNRWVTTGDPSIRDETFRSPSYLLGGLIHWSLQDEANAITADYFIPPAVFNEADNKRVADVRALLDPYLQQSIAEFVTGVRDINNDTAWNAYLSDLDRLGSQERAAIYQKYIQ